IAPPQVPKNYEPNYPIGHPKNPLTSQRSISGNYSTLPPGATQQQYGITGQMQHPQQSHYGYTGNGLSSSSLNSNSSGQYGQSMMGHPMGTHPMMNPTTP